MTAQPDTTRNARQRWHRQRQRLGKTALTVYVSDGFLDALVEQGSLSEKEAGDRYLRADRLGNLIEAVLIP